MKITNKFLGLIGLVVFSAGFHGTLEASENSILGSDKPEAQAILDFIANDNGMQIFLSENNFRILSIQEGLTADVLKQLFRTPTHSKKMLLTFQNLSGERFKYSCEWTLNHKLTDCINLDRGP